MKRFAGFIFFFFLVNVFIFGQIKLSAKTGIIETNIKETLYDKTGEDSRITSLLDWNNYLSPLVALDAEYKLADKFLFGLKGFYALPFSYGSLEDFDYMNIFSTGNSERTHYSNHKNKLDNYYNGGIYLGVKSPLVEKLSLSTVFSLSYTYYSYTALDGYKQYGSKIGNQNDNNIYSPWSDTIEKVPMQGKIISLEAQKVYFGIGTKLEYSPSDKLSLALEAELMPAFYTLALDTHYKRTLKYTIFDFTGELALNSRLLLEYKIKNNMALNAGFDILFSSAQKADLYQSTNKKNWNYASNPGELKERSWKFLLGYTYIYEK